MTASGVRPESSISEVVSSPDDANSPPTCQVPDVDDVRELMWRHCGLLRDGRGMRRALSQLGAWRAAVIGRTAVTADDDEFMRTRSIVTVGLMIARAALPREESRGGYFRSDFPTATT